MESSKEKDDKEKQEDEIKQKDEEEKYIKYGTLFKQWNDLMRKKNSRHSATGRGSGTSRGFTQSIASDGPRPAGAPVDSGPSRPPGGAGPDVGQEQAEDPPATNLSGEADARYGGATVDSRDAEPGRQAVGQLATGPDMLGGPAGWPGWLEETASPVSSQETPKFKQSLSSVAGLEVISSEEEIKGSSQTRESELSKGTYLLRDRAAMQPTDASRRAVKSE